MGVARALLALLMVTVTAACGRSEPLLHWEPEGFCSLAQLRSATLAIDTNATPGVWADTPAGRLDIAWPEGFDLVTQDEELVVVDPDGHMVAGAGDALHGFGGDTVDGVFRACIVNGASYADS